MFDEWEANDRAKYRGRSRLVSQAFYRHSSRWSYDSSGVVEA